MHLSQEIQEHRKYGFSLDSVFSGSIQDTKIVNFNKSPTKKNKAKHAISDEAAVTY